MNKRNIFSIALAAAVIVPAASHAQTDTQPEIQIGPVVQRTFTNTVPWTGTVESQVAVTLTTTLAGQIERVVAVDETAVKRGALLFQLGGTRIDTERSRLSSEVDGLKAQLQLASNTVERLRKDLGDQLSTRDQLSAAQQSAIVLHTQLQQVCIALDSFEQQTRIVAPVDGVFTARRVTEGEQVNAGDPVAELVNTNHLRIVASLFPPKDVDLLDKPATVRLADSKTCAGQVIHVVSMRSVTGATAVWIEGPEIDLALQPGQNASGNLTTQANTAYCVPESAVVYDDQEESFVFVPDGTSYERRRVTTGQTADGWMEILSGLKPDDKIVTQGAYELFCSDFTEQYKVED